MLLLKLSVPTVLLPSRVIVAGPEIRSLNVALVPAPLGTPRPLDPAPTQLPWAVSRPPERVAARFQLPPAGAAHVGEIVRMLSMVTLPPAKPSELTITDISRNVAERTPASE